MADDGNAVAAGWKKDPYGRYEARYWDGTRWTEHVVTADQVRAVDPPAGDARSTISGSAPPPRTVTQPPTSDARSTLSPSQPHAARPVADPAASEGRGTVSTSAQPPARPVAEPRSSDARSTIAGPLPSPARPAPPPSAAPLPLPDVGRPATAEARMWSTAQVVVIALVALIVGLALGASVLG